MKKIKSMFLLAAIIIIACHNSGKAQSLGLNNPTPDVSSILDMVSTTKGVLIPRMTTAERTAIAAPANGLLVYDTDLKTFYYYDAVAVTWQSFYSSAASASAIAWSIAGNAGIIDGTDYLGTSDATDLDFRTNATERMTIKSTGLVGIGLTSPAAMFHISSPSGTAQTTLFDQYASSTEVTLRRSNGVLGGESAILSGEVIGNLNFAGYNGAAFTSANARIKATATENWSAIANGTKLDFSTTPNGSTVVTTAMTIDQDQSVKIGTADQFEVDNAGNVTMVDGTLLDLSAIDASGTTEGLKLPQAADVSAGTAEGQVQWDTDDDLLQIGTGTNIKTIGIPNNIQAFTTSGNWTKPAGVNYVWVKVWGGGGGGGTGGANASDGGGGGGGYAEGLIEVSGPAGTNYVVTVGAAGAANGGNGGTSSFAGTSVTIQATGGSGTTGAAGGAGGVGSNGTINLTGGTGGTGVAIDGGNAGAGGGSPLGGAGGAGGVGGNASNPSVAGAAGTFPGGGGGGGSESGGAGAAGAAGYVIIYY